MAAVYILYSAEIDRFYIGSCHALAERIRQHSNHEFTESYTTRASDWELFWSRDGISEKQVRGIELHIKKMKSRKYLQNLKKYPEIIESLMVKYA